MVTALSQYLNSIRDNLRLDLPTEQAVISELETHIEDRLEERMSAEFNCTELWLTEFSPVMGYATGTGTLGFAFYGEG